VQNHTQNSSLALIPATKIVISSSSQDHSSIFMIVTQAQKTQTQAKKSVQSKING